MQENPMLITNRAATVFANEAAAVAFAATVVDTDAGEYFTIEFNPAGDGRCCVDLYEADGYHIARA
jgi:hypothetical protein